MRSACSQSSNRRLVIGSVQIRWKPATLSRLSLPPPEARTQAGLGTMEDTLSTHRYRHQAAPGPQPLGARQPGGRGAVKVQRCAERPQRSSVSKQDILISLLGHYLRGRSEKKIIDNDDRLHLHCEPGSPLCVRQSGWSVKRQH